MRGRFLFSCLLAALVSFPISAEGQQAPKPRVFITTDINDGKGDPDDRQSLCHLLLYANEVAVEGIVPDRFKPSALRACNLAIDLYEQDFRDPNTRFKELGYPSPDNVRGKVFADPKIASEKLVEAALANSEQPLYVLAWGNLRFVGSALRSSPEIAKHIRLITIGTNLKAKADQGDGKISNWNGAGRDEIFEQFPNLWWLEIDWTYNGMFDGQGAIELKEALARDGGRLGWHIKEVIATVTWANYFRAGDTPSLLYLLDPNHDLDDPSQASWAGRFTKPFPNKRPNYWTGIDGGYDWNYKSPAKTWDNANEVYRARIATLLSKRPEMYAAFLAKTRSLFRDSYEFQPELTGNQSIQKLTPAVVEPPKFDGKQSQTLEAEFTERSIGLEAIKDPDASGDRFIRTTENNSVNWTFDNQAEAGEYSIEIRFRSPKQTKSASRVLFTNSANLGGREFNSRSGKWSQMVEKVYLKQGLNTILLLQGTGQLDLDSIVVLPNSKR